MGCIGIGHYQGKVVRWYHSYDGHKGYFAYLIAAFVGVVTCLSMVYTSFTIGGE